MKSAKNPKDFEDLEKGGVFPVGCSLIITWGVWDLGKPMETNGFFPKSPGGSQFLVKICWSSWKLALDLTNASRTCRINSISDAVFFSLPIGFSLKDL